MRAPVKTGQTSARKPRPFMILLVLLSIMMPITFQLGSYTLSISRIILTAVSPFLMVRLFTGAYGRVNAVDICMLLFMFWRTLATYVTSASVAFEYSASNFAIIFGAYLVARASVRSLENFQYMSKILYWFVLFSLPFAIYETRTSYMVIPRFLDGVPGMSTAIDVNYLPRHGLNRVQFVFTHPIHYGLFCSTAFALMFVGMKDRIGSTFRWVGSSIVVFCCFLSVSSGPFLAVLMQVALAAYARLARNIQKKWNALLWAFGALYVVLEVFSDRPALFVISSKLAFNASTAYDRKLLMDYGMAQVWRTPVFGVGFLMKWERAPWMTGSLDNYWLASALTFGIPAFLFLLGTYLFGMFLVGRRPFKPDSPLDRARSAWQFVMFSIMATLGTVYVWGEIASLVFFIIGSGMFFLSAQEEDVTAPAPEADAPEKPKNRYSRFPAEKSRATGTLARPRTKTQGT